MRGMVNEAVADMLFLGTFFHDNYVYLAVWPMSVRQLKQVTCEVAALKKRAPQTAFAQTLVRWLSSVNSGLYFNITLFD